MSSAFFFFNLDQSKILSCGNGLNTGFSVKAKEKKKAVMDLRCHHQINQVLFSV